jgi:hypothetical protein
MSPEVTHTTAHQSQLTPSPGAPLQPTSSTNGLAKPSTHSVQKHTVSQHDNTQSIVHATAHLKLSAQARAYLAAQQSQQVGNTTTTSGGNESVFTPTPMANKAHMNRSQVH